MKPVVTLSSSEIPLDGADKTMSLKEIYTYGNLPEALMQHGHQQLGQHNNHHYVVGTDDHGSHEGAQLLCVADAGYKECNVCQGEDVPEQGVAGPHKPVEMKKYVPYTLLDTKFQIYIFNTS